MPRYIDADLLKLGINKNDEIFCTPVRPLIIDLIDNMPTADVQEVKHGRWTEDEEGYYHCSVCKELLDWNYKHCPNCGARMDGGAEQ